MNVPSLGSILAYRGVHALCTLNKDGSLHATHYATCLVGGREPMWGVWTVNGVFQRFFGSKQQIAFAYPRLTWRRKNATWNLISVNDMDAKAKREELAALFRKGATHFERPVAALFEDGDVRAWKDSFEGKAQPLFAGELANKVA